MTFIGRNRPNPVDSDGVTMLEVQILIPVADNNGHVFTTADHLAFEQVAAGLFGGVTRLPSSAWGVWVDAAKVYRDRSRIYAVGLASIVDGGKVGAMADFAKQHYRQLAIY